MTSKKKYNPNEREEEEGKGGASGSIEFRDFLAGTQTSRDDLLSSDEKRRLLSVHADIHETKVKKQKELRDQRQALKEGKLSMSAFQQGLMGAGLASQYKANPLLADKAQFSGIDRQINQLPNEHLAETNQENREELEYQFRLRNQPEHAPRFHPKPQYK